MLTLRALHAALPRAYMGYGVLHVTLEVPTRLPHLTLAQVSDALSYYRNH
jgi:hypothetical protein